MSIDDVNYILENQKAIEEKIAYSFNSYHRNLFIQMFTRKSFSVENDDYEDNEILEFYGDQLVNTLMTKWLYDSFTKIPENYNDDFFYSEKTEAELSKTRANYINKSALAHCIDVLDLDKFLLLGNSDEKNEVWRNEKVRCDLFEAIIGAIAVDSNWNFEKIENSCKKMWGMLSFEENYIRKLYDVCEDLNINEPKFSMYPNYYNYYRNQPTKCQVSFFIQNNWNPERIEGEGISETTAKMSAAKNALDFLHKYQIEQIIGNATPNTAVQDLNTLYLKKFISKPEYNCSVSPDENGNQIWRCECYIEDYENWNGYDQAGIGEEYTKSESKKSAAYDMICFILGKKK